jgi:predicted MFS family arabinose efflux permease
VSSHLDASTRSTLRLLSLTGFCSMAAMRVCDPMLVSLAHEFSISLGDASFVVSAFAVAYGMLQLFYGPLGDRIGKLRVIGIAASGCAVLNGLTALAPDFPSLVLARAAAGAMAAGIIPLAMAWVGDQVPYEHRQETLARIMSATVSGMMVGQWFGGLAAEQLGWRSAFAVLCVLFTTASSLLWLKAAPARASEQRNPSASLIAQAQASLSLLALPRVRWVLRMIAIEGALVYGTLAFVPSQLVQRFGLTPTSAGAVMMLFGAGGLLYSQFARRWLAALGEKGLARLGGLLFAAGLLVWAWSHEPLFGAAACVFSGLGFYMLHNTMQTQATQMAPQARGSGVALFASLLFFGQSAGVLLVASRVDQGSLSLTFSVVAAATALLGWLISQQLRPREASAP